MFNIQSGIFRKSFLKHSKSITSLCTDNLSRLLYSSSLDGTLCIWNIKTGASLHTITVGKPISQIHLHSESGLMAIVSDDLCIRVVDVDTYVVVREFYGHRNRILDIVRAKLKKLLFD